MVSFGEKLLFVRLQQTSLHLLLHSLCACPLCFCTEQFLKDCLYLKKVSQLFVADYQKALYVEQPPRITKMGLV
jgi:hypothetical protein